MSAGLSLPPTSKLEDIDFEKISREFTPRQGNTYALPRIAFIGYFQYLSMTRQREICKHLGFEYFREIEMATSDDSKINILQGKWSDITKDYTKLIVIGNHYDRGPAWDIEYYLYKKYKKDKKPIFVKHHIPCLMEAELFKLNVDYPNIHMNTRWEGNLRAIASKRAA